MKRIAIIVGSGLESPDFFTLEEEIYHETVFGFPDAPLLAGKVNNVGVIILSRHGKDHEIPPSKINYRANILALKELGCTHIVATTACGSLRENIHRGDLVIPDQFIDFTRSRSNTFYDHFAKGELKHTPMAEPFNAGLRQLLIANAEKLGLPFHRSGTVVTIEGPRFSTRAESKLFRAWGGDVINMTVATEVALANEAGIPYAAVAMSTDYDSWREDGDVVGWEGVLEVFRKNVHQVITLIKEAVQTI